MDAAGDERARFEQLFRRHFDGVLAYALARADLDTAKEATANTFLVAWRRRADIPSDARPWLLGVARRALAEQRRSSRRRIDLARRISSRWRPHALDPATEATGRGAVTVALRALRPTDREVLQLVAWDGLSVDELAAALGCSPAAAAVRLSRARARLARALVELDHPDPASPAPAPLTPAKELS